MVRRSRCAEIRQTGEATRRGCVVVVVDGEYEVRRRSPAAQFGLECCAHPSAVARGEAWGPVLTPTTPHVPNSFVRRRRPPNGRPMSLSASRSLDFTRCGEPAGAGQFVGVARIDEANCAAGGVTSRAFEGGPTPPRQIARRTVRTHPKIEVQRPRPSSVNLGAKGRGTGPVHAKTSREARAVAGD